MKQNLAVLRNRICVFLVLSLMIAASIRQVNAAEASGWNDLGFEAMHEFKVFDIDSGLPFLGYLTVAQTPDGFIYTGGYGGLVRYDGKRFERIKGIDNVLSLYVSQDGCLWIGTNSGSLVRMSGNDELTFYGKEEGLDIVGIRSICGDAAGNLIFGTDQGVYVLTADGELSIMDDPRLKECYVNQMTGDESGTVYGSDYDGNVFVIRDLDVAYYLDSESIPGQVQTVAADPREENAIYIGTTGSEIFHGSLEEDVESFEKTKTPGLLNINVIRQVGDLLWIGSDGGVGFIEPDGSFHRLSDPSFNSIVNMQVDYEGNLWFVSSRNGMIRISESSFADLNQIADLNERVVNTTWMDDDLLYVGTDTGLLVLDSDGRLVRNDLYDLLKNTRIRAIKGDREGNLWLCTFSDYGLVCRAEDGTIRTYNQDQGMLSNFIRTVFEMEDGTIAVSVTGGVQLLRDGEIVQTFDTSNGIPTTSVLALCEDSQGRLMLGTNGRGIYMAEGGRVVPYPAEDTMDSGVIMGIRRDDRRDCFWIITGGTLSILKDGAARTLENLPDELSANGCYDVLCADTGMVYLLCNTGIFVMDGEALASGSDVEYEHYNSKNGLPHMATPNSRSYVSPDGDAFLSCSDGVTLLNINEDHSVDVTPRLSVAFIDLDVDQMPTRLTDGQTVTVSAITRRISIHPYVLYYGLGDPRVSYYLEGFDDAPMKSTKMDLGVVSYTNLPGGTYTFHLDLDEEGLDAPEATVTIIKKKAVYELPLFWVAVLLAVFLLIVWIVRRMLRRQADALERKAMEEARQKEEERINRELNMAASIQTGALPSIFPAFPDRKEFDIFASMTPAKEVGGDFYDFFMVDDSHLGLVIADVSDKGVPAALFMMSAKMIIGSYARMGKSPKDALEAANIALTANNKAKMFVTVWLGILDLRCGRLVAANAGHEFPIVKQPDGRFQIIQDRHGLVLGGMPRMKYREYEISLEPGAKLFVYTDGVPEASNAEKEFFGLDRTVAALNEVMEGTPEQILTHVHGVVNAFVADAPQFDDLTMLCLHYKGPQGQD